ncbi:2043_t:CDS:1, partial [Paraglomus brasilianum]
LTSPSPEARLLRKSGEFGEESEIKDDAGVCPATEKKKDIRSNEAGHGCYRGICTVRRTVQYLLPRGLNSASIHSSLDCSNLIEPFWG